MIRRVCGFMIATCLATSCIFMLLFTLFAAPAAAAGNDDILGTWAITDTGGTFPQTWQVTSENFTTGDYLGTDTGTGGGAPFTLSGVVTGDTLTVQTQSGGYTSNGTGTITGTQGSYQVSGTFSDTNGTHLGFSGSQTAGGTPASTSTTSLVPSNDGLSIEKYCVLAGYITTDLERGRISGPDYAYANWACRTSAGANVLIATSGTGVLSMNNACKVEYPGGNPRHAYVFDVNNAFTWVCLEGAPISGSGLASSTAGNPQRSTIASSLATPKDAFGSAKHTIWNAIITAGIVLFIAFPSQLFNHTFQENYADIEAWWRRRSTLNRLRRWFVGSKSDADEFGGVALAGAAAVSTGTPATTTVSIGAVDEDLATEVAEGIAVAPVTTVEATEASGESAARSKRYPSVAWVVIATGAILGVMLDPAAGLNGPSITSFIAVVASTLLGMALSGFVVRRYRKIRKRTTEFVVSAIPAGLLVAVVCVFVSRVSDFQPGYLYGIICGVSFSGTLKKNEQGHTVALSMLATLVVALLAWLAWVPVNHAAAHAGALWPVVLGDDFLAAVFTGGIVGATIGLFPLRFLPGGTVAAWHKGAWALMAGCVTFVFVEVILDPKEGGHAGHASLVTAIILLVAFGGGSILFYDHFNQKKKKAETAAKAAAPA